MRSSPHRRGCSRALHSWINWFEPTRKGAALAPLAFDEHVVLNDVSFRVPNGSMLIILGVSFPLTL